PPPPPPRQPPPPPPRRSRHPSSTTQNGTRSSPSSSAPRTHLACPMRRPDMVPGCWWTSARTTTPASRGGAAAAEPWPGVVVAWVRWAGERTGLPPVAVTQLVDVTRDCSEDFREAYDQGADASPIRQFLDGLDTGGGLAEGQDGLERPRFPIDYL